MRHLLLASLLLLPFAVQARDDCKFQAPRNLQLELGGVRSVQIDLRAYDLHLRGDSAHAGELTGRACASSQELLDDLVVTQRRQGDVLIVELGRDHSSHWGFGHSYSDLQVDLKLPPAIPVTLNGGSGDAWVDGMKQVDAHVGSGDLHVKNLDGPLKASIGSGDIDVSNVGSVELGSVGSGDFKGDGIKGDVRVGSVGSGDVTVTHVGGSVRVDTIGSGDVNARDVGGDLSVGAKGSGDISYSNVRGKVNVPRDRGDD